MPFHVVLVAPEIPANTGNIARTCAATDTPLHLVDPLGFRLSDRYLKRAGLDYWQHVQLYRYPSWSALVQAHPEARFWCFSVRGKALYTEVTYQPGDWLVFGSESRGLDPLFLETYPSVRIPLRGPVRSLNLSNAVAIALFEALRQQGSLTKE
ncbi:MULTISPECIES: tRNA (cytidine(34)-2'-O)-methyltransferase [unclassified Synechococcus]|jgi:Predicted rRNA methylase (SpoU class)|uniref:tRNA (cytidine(34)-2'-O)-methyltransferase n=1 Tax=unclassified Synechococcus TaxID=2626047 RepID=UPI0000694A6A|nr:tRNA (cytidine(34)-2'-O)-methyltransferase [Synechococcus sp. JA-2-3B'a(2-13)]ABD01259.1 RNA methyltransferase, TrmH family, group 2 [Synechococcus sp. JA-2-3B'a(2-13)]MDT7946048.1 tRNA (cytidine(34)-2'-O)-methyltransferase [Cyanobacteriota bacterium PSP.bin.10]